MHRVNAVRVQRSLWTYSYHARASLALGRRSAITSLHHHHGSQLQQQQLQRRGWYAVKIQEREIEDHDTRSYYARILFACHRPLTTCLPSQVMQSPSSVRLSVRLFPLYFWNRLAFVFECLRK